MKKTAIAPLTLVTIIAVGHLLIANLPAKTPAAPRIDPANFVAVVNHPYYPLVPGTTMRFTVTDGDEISERTVTVTRDSKKIMGVKCTVVHDVVAAKGKILEETCDWFAQDKTGTVWYFGEATKDFEKPGHISTEGSWEAGVNGQPGIIMPAHPAPGAPYRQEYSPNNAEDMGQIVAVGDAVTVPFGAFKDCVRTKEWSMLESGSEKKWYAKGVGLIKEESMSGEVVTLVSVRHE